jgi:hypothetical protein
MRDALELGGGRGFHQFLREGVAPMGLMLAGTAIRGWPRPRGSVGRAAAFAVGSLSTLWRTERPLPSTSPRRPGL